MMLHCRPATSPDMPAQQRQGVPSTIGHCFRAGAPASCGKHLHRNAGPRLSGAVDESLPNSGGEEEEAEAGVLGHQKSGLSHMADYVMDDDDYVAATKTNRARQRVNVRRSAPGGGRGRGGRRRRDPDDDEAEEGAGRKRRKRGEELFRGAALLVLYGWGWDVAQTCADPGAKP